MTEERPKPIPFRLSDYSPNTHMILGAALSGGDPLKMAEMLVNQQAPTCEWNAACLAPATGDYECMQMGTLHFCDEHLKAAEAGEAEHYADD